jgi:hypothetical protein
VRPWERRAFNIAAFLVAASGFAYFWMKYFVQSDDPFAVVNHPWQGAMLTLHLLASPPLILLFGIILNSHIMRKLRAPRAANRTSGLLSFGTFATMVVTGYLLQVTMDERWLQALVAVHVASGALFSGAYAIHLFISSRLFRTRAASTAFREVA